MRLRSFVLAAALAIVSPALAHEARGPNGGRLVDAGEYHVELVANGAQVTVFLTDAGDKPVPAAGFKGTAILLAEGKPQRIALQPAKANVLAGESPVSVPADAKGAVQLTTPDGKTAQGKFN
jgi:hypothetical protein